MEWNRDGDRICAERDASMNCSRSRWSRSPEAVAVICEGQQLSYRELNRRANQLGHYLRGLGVGPEVVVGFCLERSVEMVVALAGSAQGRRSLSAAGSGAIRRRGWAICWRMQAP